MPVLSENHHPSSTAGHQMTTSANTSNPYLLISLAFLLTLGFSISRRMRSEGGTKEKKGALLCEKRETDARMMQESLPSALPEKPYLPNPAPLTHIMEHQQATVQSQAQETCKQEHQSQQTNSSPTQQFQHHFSNHEISDKQSPPLSYTPHSQQPLFQKRLGSFPAVSTSLLHPEPPSPTIAIAPMKIHTQIPYQPQNQQNENQQPQFPGQTPILGQYTQDEILFVPSPTVYTSFESLYSKYPPPIYHAPNPTSYTSMDSNISTNPTSFSVTEGNPDYQDTSLPRRRSYTKTLSNGSEMSGEIIVSGVEGGATAMGGQWRRHTRVFGGGVCRACEESERRRVTA